MSMIEEIIKRILDQLTGFDYCVTITAVVVCTIGWFFVGSDNAGQKKLKRQLKLVVMVLIVTVLLIGIHYLIPSKRFSSDVAGILVLRIAGDDSSNSLQNELVSSLNTELSKGATSQTIEVWADDDLVTEKQGLPMAYKKAREIGERRKALLVIWGSTSDKIRFFPRVTVVPITGPLGDGTLSVQDIREVSLPVETVQTPILIANFIAGFTFYNKGLYEKAVNCFESTINSGHVAMPAAADLILFDGFSHWFLAYGQVNMTEHLEKAIYYLSAAGSFYQATGNTQSLAKALATLGAAYDEIKVGNRADNLNKAIMAYQTALSFVSEKDNPAQWGVLQNNLGNAWRDLPSGNHTENILRAIEAFKAALRVRTETDYPYQWAMTQNNLGMAYRTLESGNKVENLQKAIVAFQVAQRVLNEKNYPIDWGLGQNGLGNIYSELAGLPDNEKTEDVKRAIGFYQAALRTLTETNAPIQWAMIQNNLGGAYFLMSQDDHGESSKLALAAHQAALRVYNEKEFPVDWAKSQIGLAIVYGDLPTGERFENLKLAISTYRQALRVLTETNSPDEWAVAQYSLAFDFIRLSQFENPVGNFTQAKQCLLNSLKIWTPNDFPENNQKASKILQTVEAGLSSQRLN